MKRTPVVFKKPRAKTAYCWLCSRQLYAGGRAYVTVRDEAGIPHAVHETCANENEMEFSK